LFDADLRARVSSGTLSFAPTCPGLKPQFSHQPESSKQVPSFGAVAVAVDIYACGQIADAFPAEHLSTGIAHAF